MNRISRQLHLSGFSLVEITLALGVAAFCLLAVVGLLQTGLTSEQTTVGKTAAWGILSSVLTDLSSTPSGRTHSATYGIPLSGLSAPQTVYFTKSGKPTGAAGSAPEEDSFFRVSVELKNQPPTSTAPIFTRLLVTWPAAADPVPDQWPSKAAGSVEVVTALPRN